MSRENVIDNGARVAVALPCYTGEGGMSRPAGRAEATIAVREKVRASFAGPGFVDGEAVEVLRIEKSKLVQGMTLIFVRFVIPAAAE